MDSYIYLTDNLIMNESCLYNINDDNNKLTRISTRNMLKYLETSGWKELDTDWNEFLLNNSTKTYCPFLIMECGGNGDCLFYCISEALNNIYQFPEHLCELPYSVSYLRNLVADQITNENFEIILESYKAAAEVNELMDDWDPFLINSIDDLKLQLKKTGMDCWGDHIMLQLLQSALNLNVIIFNNYIFSENDNNINTMGQDIYQYDKTVILYYIDHLHFQLIGYFNGKTIQTVFDKDKLPNEIIKFIND